jgi:hypothetical protein
LIIPIYSLLVDYFEKGNQKEDRRGFYLGSYRAMDLFPNSNPLLDCLSVNILEELLNDFSKYYPNLTLIKKKLRFWY